MSDTKANDAMELLTFRLADQEYALDIMSVREIRGWTQATTLPHAPPFIKGVINLRGTVLPVMDLAHRLGVEQSEQNDRNVIIVVMSEDTMTGLLVDAVSDIVTVTSDDLQPPPEMSTDPAEAVVCALTIFEDRMIRILDLPMTVAASEAAAA